MRNPAPDDPAKPWPIRFRDILVRFGNLSLALLLAFLSARVVEMAGLALIAEVPADIWTVVGRTLWTDALFYLKLLAFILPLFLLLRLVFRGQRADLVSYGIIGTAVLAACLLLVNYFFVARVPLGADLFGYSPGDILGIARAGYRISLLSIASLVIPLAVFWTALVYFGTHTVLPWRIVFAALLGGILLIAFGGTVLPPRTAFKSEFSYGMALNKGAFFAADTYAYLMPHDPGPGAARPVVSRFRYLDPEYPFLREENTPDVLGEYFRIDPARPPNIVFLAVEGLGRAFSGPDAYLGSFTPFLDELAGKSLYWENFLASQGRTFASLPSILGSLPFGSRGFNDLGARMPRHLTLLSILKRHGYRTRFYCGNSLDFDNQRAFLERQNIDLMVGMDDYDDSYYRLPGAYWGYADREVLQKALTTQRKDPRTPYVDYVQTVSMHTPYSVPGQAEYLRRFEEHMDRLGFTEAVKKKYRQYRNIYSTVLYTDAALQYYFEEQARLPSYRNTIFLITGDHRLPEIPMSTKIDRYHVPLIIYSPMLKRAARIKSISSHLDITPSLLAFLKRNYRVRTPDKVAWVGTGLDMEPAFRNIHSYPMKHTINNLIDYISGMYFLNDSTLFAIGRNMDLEPIHDEEKMKELRAEFELYKAMNARFVKELKLIPGDIHAAYFPAR
ncbi:MAG: LTA synthase family protein [Pseudomonadota bacterium]